MPFQRMKVRLKKEIVTLGVEGVDPSPALGAYVAPEDWNALIADPDVLVIDTRNELRGGSRQFQNAIDPGTKSFGDFPSFVRREAVRREAPEDRDVLHRRHSLREGDELHARRGFENVYHLKGGILKYLETVPPKEPVARLLLRVR
jgi:UPF0176 protein